MPFRANLNHCLCPSLLTHSAYYFALGMCLSILATRSSSMTFAQERDPSSGEPAIGPTPQAVSDAVAENWAQLVLAGVDTEFPNKLSVTYANASQIATPREMFPAFFGCFDWHSSVHGHWLLAKILKSHPRIASADAIRDALNRHLTQENILAETAFFSREEQKSFERMYGWAWYLRLVAEVDTWNDNDARRWRENLRPLEHLLVSRIKAYLPRLEYPIRTGEHPDTGFALGQILDYATIIHDSELEQLVVARAKKYYTTDARYPVEYEPSGQDFFSSGWNEADLMRRIIEPSKFAVWLNRFLPDLDEQLGDGTISPVAVSDLTDGKLVHLAGLNLNRAWCMQSVAESLPKDHPLRKPLRQSAIGHLQAGLNYINSGHYEGDHWLATFGLYASSVESRR
jgi:hypothetical protein